MKTKIIVGLSIIIFSGAVVQAADSSKNKNTEDSSMRPQSLPYQPGVDVNGFPVELVAIADRFASIRAVGLYVDSITYKENAAFAGGKTVAVLRLVNSDNKNVLKNKLYSMNTNGHFGMFNIAGENNLLGVTIEALKAFVSELPQVAAINTHPPSPMLLSQKPKPLPAPQVKLVEKIADGQEKPLRSDLQSYATNVAQFINEGLVPPTQFYVDKIQYIEQSATVGLDQKVFSLHFASRAYGNKVADILASENIDMDLSRDGTVGIITLESAKTLKPDGKAKKTSSIDDRRE